MEGYGPGDPAIIRKRTMMRAGIGFLDQCDATAVVADPSLRDVERVCEAIYPKRYRYGEDAWKRAVERSKKTGRLPWSDPAAETAVIRKKRE